MHKRMSPHGDMDHLGNSKYLINNFNVGIMCLLILISFVVILPILLFIPKYNIKFTSTAYIEDIIIKKKIFNHIRQN